jgi:hypothetical protein
VAWRREFDNLVAAKAVDRLWAKDVTLWQGPEGQKRSVGGNLAWLDLPDHIGAYMERAHNWRNPENRKAFGTWSSLPWVIPTWPRRLC